MQKSLFHIPARKVKALSGYKIESMQDVAELQKLGIAMDSQSLSEMYNAYRKYAAQSGNAFAMDSDYVAPLSTPSLMTPIQFLQSWAPGFVNVVTRAMVADEAVGINTIGRWEDEEVVQGFAEKTGRAKPFQDETNVPFASYNTNFERRSIVRFELGMKIGRLEEARAAAMNYNSADAKRAAVAQALEIERNYIAFYGYNSGAGRTYGILNDPSLPAYVNLPNGAGGSPLWANKTTLEIIQDILSAGQALRTRSGALVDLSRVPATLLVASDVVDYLKTPTTLGFSAEGWLQTNFPLMRIVPAPELNAANGGANVFYLYAEDYGDGSTDDGRVWMQMVPAKFKTIGVMQLTKGYEEDYGNATAGVMLKRPAFVIRRSGC